MSAPGIEVRALSKRFGALSALADVSFSVLSGSTTVLLGPNGAGKTTLLRIVAGLSKPTSGAVRVGSVDLAESADEVRSQFGVISHQTMLYDDLTARENLAFYGRLYSLGDLDGSVDRALADVHLAERAEDRVRTFSRGMKQRLAIARATIHDPDYLLFDEPFTGLDVAGRDVLTERIRYLQEQGRTAILVTHDLHQAVALGERFVMLVKGRVVRDGDCEYVDELEREMQKAK